MENQIFTFKKIILPRLEICRPGWPHHSPASHKYRPWTASCWCYCTHTQQYSMCSADRSLHTSKYVLVLFYFISHLINILFRAQIKILQDKNKIKLIRNIK